jgi:hypothetical protein
MREKEASMDCGIKGCTQVPLNTYSYSAPLKANPHMAENLTVAVPLCEDHSRRKPDTLSQDELK